jgi:predicted metal-dependent phosphoesterase TrpH
MQRERWPRHPLAVGTRARARGGNSLLIEWRLACRIEHLQELSSGGVEADPGHGAVVYYTMLKVELHAHTEDDPVDTIPHSTRDLIDRAATQGFDALAITLHDHQLDLRPWQSYAADRGVVLIPGTERTIHGKHVLLLNFSSGTEHVRTFDDLAALRRRSPGLVIAPHPFFPARSCLWNDLTRHADLFDAVERNAMFTRAVDFNRPAERWAAEHGKPMVGNGDIHRLQQLGTTYSLVDAERNPDAICQAILSGRVRVVSRPLPWSEVTGVLASLATTLRRRPSGTRRA